MNPTTPLHGDPLNDEKLEKNYRSTPYLYDLALSNIGVKVVRQGTSKPKPWPTNSSETEIPSS